MYENIKDELELTETSDFCETENFNKKNKRTNPLFIVLLCIMIFFIYGLIFFAGIFMLFDKTNNIEDYFPVFDSKTINFEIADESNRPYINLSNLFDEHNFGILSSKEIFENNCNSVVVVSTEVDSIFYNSEKPAYCTGTGFFISSNGYIITNFHVIEDSLGDIFVTTYNGKQHKALVIGYNPENDFAILKIDGDNFTPVKFGSLRDMSIGEEVVCIGHPLGIYNYSITKGILSAMNRTVNLDEDIKINMFQVDCPLNEGNSGGPIFNMYGEVVGITTAKYDSDEVEGIGFCIPIDDIFDYIQQIIEYGEIKYKAYIGITAITVPFDAAIEYNLIEGAYIDSIQQGSCAEKAGILVGDIVISFGEYKIKSSNDLVSAKKQYRAGETVETTIWRNGEVLSIYITLDNELDINYLNNNEEIKINENPNNWYNKYYGYNS